MLVLRLLSSFFKHLCWFCVHGRRGPRRERDTHGESSRSKHLYRTRGLYQLLHLTNPVRIRRQRRPTRTKADTDTEDNNEESVLFDVCRQVFVRSANRQLSKFFILIPTGSHRTGIIFDHAGLSHEGLDSNNFVVAQHTTYFEISSFSTNSEDSYFLL